jgi:hypothetical protein
LRSVKRELRAGENILHGRTEFFLAADSGGK